MCTSRDLATNWTHTTPNRSDSSPYSLQPVSNQTPSRGVAYKDLKGARFGLTSLSSVRDLVWTSELLLKGKDFLERLPLIKCGITLCAFYFCRLIGKPDRLFTASAVQLAQSNQFHYRRTVFSSQLKSKVGNILTKAAALRINGAPIASRSHTQP
jgi:hypothetical protein